MLLASYGQSESVHGALMSRAVGSEVIGAAAAVVDPRREIDGLADFEYYVIGQQGDTPPTRAVSIVEMPDGSWTVAAPESVAAEVRGHLVGSFLRHHILGESVGGILLATSKKLDVDARDQLLLASKMCLSTAHLVLTGADPVDMMKQTGNPLAVSLRDLRMGDGMVFDWLPEVRRFNHEILRGGSLDLPRAKVKLVLDERARTSLVLGNDFVQEVSLTRERNKSPKPHTCISCRAAIVLGSPRLTIGTQPRDGFDHHHMHAFCGSLVL